MSETLRWWVTEWARLGPQAFVAEHGTPALVALARLDAPMTGGQKFMTIRMGKSSHLTADPLDLPVYQVRKIEGRNVFGMMVTVGRAANNDIQIEATSVSKFHAYLEERDGTWYVKDANSSNGTFLGETQLGADGPAELGDGVEIRFARVRCRFLLPESFQGLLMKEAKRLRSRGELE
jgi:hypothetical protein